MTKRVLAAVVIIAGLAAPAAFAAAKTYDADKAHTTILFTIRHLLTDVDGKFTDFSGTMTYDRDKPENSSVEFTVQAASVDTNVQKRDDDLRSANFFDVAKHPTITFKSTKVAPKGKDAADVTGEFTLHGVTKTITVPVKLTGVIDSSEWGSKAGFKTSFTISRKEYGITWNKVLDSGNVVLGDEVTITINVEANGRREEKPAAR